MTAVNHREVLERFAEAMDHHDWAKLDESVHPDVVCEYPQSGERFRGIENFRAQFENYPNFDTATSHLEEVVGGASYALTPAYTLVAVEGSGDRGAAIVRARYPDGSTWWAINFYELRDGQIARTRTFFAPDFDAPDWRAPFRDGEPTPPPEP
jgi:ketosteroid isomerase-like protein